MKVERRNYDKQFKEEAVKMVLSGRKQKEEAENLGINSQMLSKWKRDYEKNMEEAFPGKGYLKPQDEEMRRLKKQLTDVTMERDILKKAVAIFWRQPK